MHLDAIRVEAHYSALLAERSNMIVSLVGQIEELQKRIKVLEDGKEATEATSAAATP